MNWQIKTRVWGHVIPRPGWHLGNRRINRIYYIHSGEAYVETEQKRIPLRPGYLYILPENIHLEAGMSDENPMDHTYFDFDAIPCFHFQDIIELPVADYPLIQKWLELSEEILRTYNGQQWKPEILSMINLSLQNLLFILSGITELPVVKDPRILDTLIFIQEHLSERMTVEELADRVFLDKHYFIRLFARSTGQPPHNYIQSKRMNRAAALLQRGISATETAERCGYGSYSTFARAFQDYYGCAPTKYQAT